jgi:predicted  nucleic acid-binding Zn-ribbon protein
MPSATEQAVRHLEAALESLEYAVEQRLSQATGADGLAEEVQMLSSDRAELAEALDQAQARAAKLEHVNRDVSRRLDGAIAAIRELLAAEAEEGD